MQAKKWTEVYLLQILETKSIVYPKFTNSSLTQTVIIWEKKNKKHKATKKDNVSRWTSCL